MFYIFSEFSNLYNFGGAMSNDNNESILKYVNINHYSTFKSNSNISIQQK